MSQQRAIMKKQLHILILTLSIFLLLSTITHATEVPDGGGLTGGQTQHGNEGENQGGNGTCQSKTPDTAPQKSQQ